MKTPKAKIIKKAPKVPKVTKAQKAKKASEASGLEITRELAGKLLSLLGVEGKLNVLEDSESGVINVNIDAPEATGLLIGRFGETLISFQTILGMMVRQKTGEWLRIVVNVGDWREKQEAKLKDLARQVAEKVVASGEPQPIYNLNATQRRIIHLELAASPDVATESVGEDRERYLLVKPKVSS